MGRTTLTVSKEDFLKDYLESFASKVKSKIYSKMEYTNWKKLKSWAENKGYDYIFIEEDNYTDLLENSQEVWQVGLGSYTIKVSPGAEPFNKEDGSFGSFLSDKISNKISLQAALEQIRGTTAKASNTLSSASSGITDYATTISSGISSCSNKITDLNTSLITPYTEEYWVSDSTASKKAAISNELSIDSEYLKGLIDQTINECCEDKNANEKEKTNMNFNFDFGPVDSSVRMSMYGMAIKNANNTYVAYDAKTKQIMDVDIVSFEGASDFMYKMPVAMKDIAVGDVVVHSRKPMFVSAIRKDNRLEVMDIYSGEEKTIVLAQSPFGFNFATKVVSLINFGGADSANPFGNIFPFMLMSNSKNIDDVLPFILMSGQGNIQNNPMLMYALMSKNDNMKDMIPFLLMMPTNNAGCNCNCQCCEDEKNQ